MNQISQKLFTVMGELS